MLELLIVDDELEEREGIAFLITELHLDYHPSFAENGRKAIEYLSKNHVDVLITDIRMPFMDGLALANFVTAGYPEIKIIIYSGYSEFSYAQQALKLGVTDYILKPVKIPDFEATMLHAAAAVLQERKEKSVQNLNFKFARKHILLNILNDADGLSYTSDAYPAYLPSTCFRMLLLEFDTAFFDTNGPDFEDRIAQWMPPDFIYLNMDMNRGIFLIPLAHDLEWYKKLITGIQEWLAEAYGLKSFWVISSLLDSGSDLAAAYKNTEHLIESRFYFPEKFIFDEQSAMVPDQSFVPPETDDVLIDNIHAALQANEFGSLEINFQLLCKKYESQTNLSYLYMKFIFCNLYKDITDKLSSVHTVTSDISFDETVDTIYRQTDLRRVITIVKSALDELLTCAAEKNNCLSRDIIRIQDYIRENSGESLDLNSLSDYIHFSPGYLCTLFKKETGCGINKYIKTVRMEKAKNLLCNSPLKVKEIAEAVGYHNLSYFCQSYKEFYGVTPDKYRQNTALGGNL